MMNAKGFAALLSICMLAALPACCWKGCHRSKCEETREDGYSRREERKNNEEYKEPKTKRSYKKTVVESDM